MAITDSEWHRLLKQLRDALKDFSAQLDSVGRVSLAIRQPSTNVQGVISGLSALQSSLEALLATTNSTLSSINSKDFATQTTLASLNSKDFATEAKLDSVNEFQSLINSNTNATKTSTALTASRVDDLKNFIAFFGSKSVTEYLSNIRGAVLAIESDTGAMSIDLAALEVLATTAATARSDMNSELDSIDDNWNLLSVNRITIVATLAAVLNNATSGRQDTAQTSFDTMLTDNDAIIADLAAIEVLLGTIDSDTSDIRISNNNTAARIIEVGSTHTFNWFLDFTVDGGGAGTVIITLICPTGQKMTNIWFSTHMPVQTQTDESVTVIHTTAGDENKRVAENTTFPNTTAAHHAPRAQTADNIMDGSSGPLNMAAGEKLVFSFSSLTAADQFHINLGCDLRDGTVVAASGKAGTATITVNQEDHEEIA